MSDDFQFPEPVPEAEQSPEPLPRQRAPTVLPWMVAALAVVALGVVSVYAKKLIDDQSARAYQAMRMADEVGSRANKMEADQKDARRQAITSSEKTDELRAANARLTEQVTDKDSALAHLRERHKQLVTRRAVSHAHLQGKGAGEEARPHPRPRRCGGAFRGPPGAHQPVARRGHPPTLRRPPGAGG